MAILDTELESPEDDTYRNVELPSAAIYDLVTKLASSVEDSLEAEQLSV